MATIGQAAARTAPRKPFRGLAMEGIIASWYAKNTARDTRDYRRVAQAVTCGLSAGRSVLEVAPGPGYMAIEMAKAGDFRVTGLDISKSFVRIATDNAARAGVNIDFRLGNASDMPFAADSFERIACRAAFKNFSDPLGALDEIHRVLTPGGRALIYDLRKDASMADIDEEIACMRLSRINALLTKITFRTVLLKTAYTRDALERLVADSRFGTGDIRQDGIGFELRLIK